MVAGNPACLDDHEKNTPAGRHVLGAIVELKNMAYNCLVMVGTGNMTKTAYKALTIHRVVPLALLGPKTFEEIKTYLENCVGKGVYTSFYVGEPVEKM